MNRDFIGAGWAFPLRIDRTGSIELVRAEREIAESIHLILGTSPGERPMRPDFGCAIHDLVFAPANAGTAGLISAEVRHALERWEPRIDLGDVRVDFGRAAEGILLIDIRYKIRGFNDPRNLVFPFYVIPQHDSTPGGP
ncbi:GPW/gp25 family protein [Nonomuraea longicatena]|uniref:GPW/gp25 family protein n=1 Tax=Nonomuraea longicatena TaxID=83682 RepID=A0ABP3Z7B3_9ACTN